MTLNTNGRAHEDDERQHAARGLLFASLFFLPIVPALLAIVAGGRLLASKRASRGLAVVIVTAGLISLVAWCIPVLLLLARVRDNIYIATCVSDGVNVYRDMLLFSDEKGRFPKDFGELASWMKLPPGFYYCRAKADATGVDHSQITDPSFTFIYYQPRPEDLGSQDVILLHESLSNHGGRGAVFVLGDGTAHWLDPIAAEETLRRHFDRTRGDSAVSSTQPTVE